MAGGPGRALADRPADLAHTEAQIAQLAASLNVWGWTNPVLADEVGGVIAGHARILAARQLGIAEIPSPLIGRDEEIDLLLRRWTRAKAGDGQIVLISGEPGLGKSAPHRGLNEHLHAEPHTRLRYFCSPYHRDSALFPFIEQLGRASGFARDDPPTARLEKLEALLARAAPPDEDMALIGDLLSLPASGRYPLPNLSPQGKKEKTLNALIRQLEGLARQQPVVVVFEDAHWIDSTSRELLDLTVERVRSLPVLLIVTFRPKFQPPPWTGLPQVSMVGGQAHGAGLGPPFRNRRAAPWADSGDVVSAASIPGRSLDATFEHVGSPKFRIYLNCHSCGQRVGGSRCRHSSAGRKPTNVIELPIALSRTIIPTSR